MTLYDLERLGPGKWLRDGVGGSYYHLPDGTQCAVVEGVVCSVWSPKGDGNAKNPDLQWGVRVQSSSPYPIIRPSNRFCRGAAVVVMARMGFFEIDEDLYERYLEWADPEDLVRFSLSLPQTLSGD